MESKISSIISKDDQPIRNTEMVASSWHMVVALVAVFLVLKVFIYIKDGKRHGK
ncbi:hypothetical protein N9O57_00545 [bacterium]|nr:hypothetical protein [bacterium]